MIEQFTERDDSFEKEYIVGSDIVLVSVDKDELTKETDKILEHVVANIERLINDSLRYINEIKEEYEIGHIDDFSNPGIFVGHDNFSVYWDSEKGEEIGVTVIGADFYWPERKWQGLTLGD